MDMRSRKTRIHPATGTNLPLAVVRMLWAAVLLSYGAQNVRADGVGTASTGTGGLQRVYAAEPVVSGLSVFKAQTGFFQANRLMVDNDKHQALDTQLSYTYAMQGAPFAQRFEWAFSLEGKSHTLRTPDTGSESFGYFGNPSLSAKFHAVEAGPYALSLASVVRTFTPERIASIELSTLSPSFLLLQTLNPGPFHLHLNAGFYQDRSDRAFERDPATVTRPIRFARGSYIEDSWILGLAAEIRTRTVTAYVEGLTYQDLDRMVYSSAPANGDAGELMREKTDFIQNPIWVTPGVKVRVAKHWLIDSALDLGVLSGDFPGEIDRDILPPWRFLIGVSYLTKFERRFDRRMANSAGQNTEEAAQPASPHPIRESDAPPPSASVPPLAPRASAVQPPLPKEAPATKPVETARLAEPEPAAEEMLQRLNRQLQFTFNDTSLNAALLPVLDEIARILRRHPNVMLRVVGHTDRSGPTDANRKISLQRAINVVDYLAARGIDRKRLVPVAMYFRQPIASEATRAGRVRNRRATLDAFTTAPWHMEFGFNETRLPADAGPILDQIARSLAGHSSRMVRIEGHSDSLGSPLANFYVAGVRAQSAAEALSIRGVIPRQMDVRSHGDLKPVAPNEDPQGRSLNRRVDFYIIEDKSDFHGLPLAP